MPTPNAGAMPKLPIAQLSCSPMLSWSSLLERGRSDIATNRCTASTAIRASPAGVVATPASATVLATLEPTMERTTEEVVEATADTTRETISDVATVALMTSASCQ